MPNIKDLLQPSLIMDFCKFELMRSFPLLLEWIFLHNKLFFYLCFIPNRDDFFKKMDKKFNQIIRHHHKL